MENLNQFSFRKRKMCTHSLRFSEELTQFLEESKKIGENSFAEKSAKIRKSSGKISFSRKFSVGPGLSAIFSFFAKTMQNNFSAGIWFNNKL